MYSKFDHFTSLTGRYQQRNLWKRRANIARRAEPLVWVIRPVHIFVCCPQARSVVLRDSIILEYHVSVVIRLVCCPQARSRQFFCLFVFFFFFFSLKPILLFQAKSVSKLYQWNYFMYTEECLEHFKDYNDIIRRSMFCLSSLLHPFRNHWWALQSDWLSAVPLLHESHHFLL